MFPKVVPDLKYWLLLQCVGGFTLSICSLQFYLPCFNPPAIREASKKKKNLNSFRGKAAWLFYDDYDYFRLSDYPLAGKTKKPQKNKKKKKKEKMKGKSLKA